MELIIKLEHFNAKFLQINMPNSKRPNFYNIIYNSPTVVLNNLIFETPWMDVPFGICQYNNNDEKQKNKYYIDLSFNGFNINDELHNFYNCMNDIDDFIIDFLYQNRHSLNLMGNVESYYSKQIRFNKNNSSYPPTLKLKIFKGITKIFNTEHSPVNFDSYVKPGSKSKAYIKCNGLWVFNNKFGMSWKVMKLISKPTTLSKKLYFIDPEPVIEEDSKMLFIYDDYNKEFVEDEHHFTEAELKLMEDMEYEIEELERNRNFAIKENYMKNIKIQNEDDYHIIEPDDVTYLIEHCSHQQSNNDIITEIIEEN
jgi:hypothetical protein